MRTHEWGRYTLMQSGSIQKRILLQGQPSGLYIDGQNDPLSYDWPDKAALSSFATEAPSMLPPMTITREGCNIDVALAAVVLRSHR